MGVASPLNQTFANVKNRTTYMASLVIYDMCLDTESAFAIAKSYTLFSSQNTPNLVMNLWHTKFVLLLLL